MTAPDNSRGAVLVTGGAQGIGRAIATALIETGTPAAVLDPDAEALAELRALHAEHDLLTIEGDVASEADAARAVETASTTFGGLRGLVNNAGIGIGKPLERLELSEWNRVLSVNLTGAFLMAKHAAAALRSTGGAIVNVASTRALMSEPDTEAYAASKGGLLALTHALAVSLGPAVRVNAISPGWIEVRDWQKAAARAAPAHRDVDHAQHPAGRVGRPEDVASLSLYLLSSAADFITGQNFVVDGGMTKKMIYVE